MSTINAIAGNASSITALVKSSDGTANLTFQTNSLGAITIDANQNANFARCRRGGFKRPDHETYLRLVWRTTTDAWRY